MPQTAQFDPNATYQPDSAVVAGFDPSATYQPAASPGTASVDDDRSLLDHLANDPNTVPLDSYTHATERGIANIGQGGAQAVQGTISLLNPKPQDENEKKVAAINPLAVPVYRLLRGIGHSAGDAVRLAQAYHESGGPSLEELGDVAGTTAGNLMTSEVLGQGTGAAGRGVKAAIEAPAETLKTVATVPVRLAARTAESAINQKLVPAKPLLRIMTPADEAEAVHIKVPGRDLGLPAKTTPKPAAAAPAPTIATTAGEQSSLPLVMGEHVGEEAAPAASPEAASGSRTAARGDDEIEADFKERYPEKQEGDTVSGLKIKDEVTRHDLQSIGATLPKHLIMDGFREIPIDEIPKEQSTLPLGHEDRVSDLGSEIDKSGEITPLVVGMGSKGPYVLEGMHRLDALRARGATHIPAVIALDLDELRESSPGKASAAAPAAQFDLPAQFDPNATYQPAKVESLLNDALGGKPLEKNVPLRQQVPQSSTAKSSAASSRELPEGFTPTESSVLAGYKYDPATQEFESITNAGQHYVHGEVTPDQAADFEAAESKGKAWNKMRGSSVLVAKVLNGVRKPITGFSAVESGAAAGDVVPKKQAGMRSVELDPETGRPEFSDVLAARKPKVAPAAAESVKSPAVPSTPKAAPAPELVPIERYSAPGNEKGRFYAPAGEAKAEFGDVLSKAHVDVSQLYKGTSSIDLAKEGGYYDKPIPPEAAEQVADDQAMVEPEWIEQHNLPRQIKTLGDLAQYEGFMNGDGSYHAFQIAAEKYLKAKGYKGAYWSEEDDLNPRQYQIWDRSAIHEAGEKPAAGPASPKPAVGSRNAVSGEVLSKDAALPKPRLDEIAEELRGQYPKNTDAQIQSAAKEQLAFEESRQAFDQRRAASAKPKADEDLTPLLQQSLDKVNLDKGAVHTTATPASLAKRWGVDSDSLAAGREQTRGMSPEQTEQYIAKLVESYKKGTPVEPVMETRDAQNNIIAVDGRARAIAAGRAGVKRIPIIVRRLKQ